MLVLEGELHETLYDTDSLLEDGKSIDSRAGRTRILGAGDSAYINDSIGYHKVGNPTNARAVSLHVYAPGWQTPRLFDEVTSEGSEDVDAGGAPFDVDWGDF